MYESVGMLGQLIRCVSQPGKDPLSTRSFVVILDALAKCTTLIKKKLCKGEATGIILDQVIAGKDGFKGRRLDEVMTRLVNLQRAASLNESFFAARSGNVSIGQMCRYCNKAEMTESFQEKLLICR
jgi:hypothetical protein